MSYWHLFAGTVTMPVVVNGVHTADALGIAQALVGPVERPPIEEDGVDDETGRRYPHIASWNREPTETEMDAMIFQHYPQYAEEEPFLVMKRDDDEPQWTPR